MNPRRHSSVRWRIVLVYFLLVFIAMTIVSVFLMGRIEDYQLDSLTENITNTVNESNLLTSLGNYDELTPASGDIQKMLAESWTAGFSEELSVVDTDLNICASTNINLVGRSAADLFDSSLIVNCLTLDSSQRSNESDTQTGDGIPVKNLCFTIESEGRITGVVYVRSDLTNINNFLAQSKTIFIQAIILALVVTVVLGFILARSITDPINSVTQTVQKMSQGDFTTEVDVRSDDEIGQLAEMFNLLRRKLDFTLTEISNEKNKLGTILQYMADGLIAIDLDGSVIHVNPAARQMLHIAMDADVSRFSYHQIMGRLSDNLALEKIRENCDADGGQDIFRYGNAIIALRYDHFKDEEGTDIGIIIIMQDITERQKLEDMQTDFVANVSHELRTPLTTIKSYAETLLDGAVTDKETQDQFLEIINKETDRMTRLVKELLQLSRLDHRQEPMDIKEGNLIAMVNSVASKMTMTAHQKGQSIICDYDQNEDIRVMFDKDMIEQVLQNIFSNSIKYTQDGGQITVRTSHGDGVVKVSIADNGIGIPAESIPRIFERFYRVDKARSRAMGSTGLGLAISKQIVEEHGGSIVCESEEGKGTRMTLALPLVVKRGIRNVE
ncbi:MAG: cell wall metabolism sensor histidine kinase WalK [Clostridia bacterium]|nr:cell wall metabolism sensor histidine kinase WalK [Clostridia bacterium]